MKLTVISNTYCLAVTGSSYTITEQNNDNSNPLCDKFHHIVPAQSSP